MTWRGVPVSAGPSRWALHEAERERSRLAAAVADGAAAVEEMRRVARAAVAARQEAERLAEELAEVVEAGGAHPSPLTACAYYTCTNSHPHSVVSP